MGFSTKPILSDNYFQQPYGEVLTMSGDTNFVGTLKSKGVELNLDTTSATTGYVVTLDVDGKVKLKEPQGGGGTDIITPYKSPIWTGDTTYAAGEFVSYVNPGSSNPQFQINYIYVAQTDIPANISPEDDQINWLWAGDSDTANGAVADANAIRQITNYKVGHCVIDISQAFIFKVVDNLANIADDGVNVIKPNDVALSAGTRWSKFYDLNTSLNAYKITNLFANKHTYNSLSGQSTIVIGNYDNYEIFITDGAATLVPTFASTIPTYGERLCVVTNQKATSITIQLPTLNYTDGRQYIGNVATISINQNESVELHYLFLPTTIRIVAQKYTYRSS